MPELGSRLAIVGGGPAAWALAASVLLSGRARGRQLDVKVYAPDSSGDVLPPAVLTPECRARLAALGAAVPASWRTVQLDAVEVSSGDCVERLVAPQGSLWTVDGPDGGLARVTRSLASVACLHGARVASQRVDRVQRLAADREEKRDGDLLVWAHGRPERFHAVALASGARHAGDEHLVDGLGAAPTCSAIHGWIRTPRDAGNVLRLTLSSVPGVWGLFLVPGRGRVYALAFGPRVETADFCSAVMVAAREHLLPDDFELETVAATRLPMGAGRAAATPGQFSVGSRALGHPLQIGLSETLAVVGRAALAWVDGGTRSQGMVELMNNARRGASAAGWLARAGRWGPRALVRARGRPAYLAPFSTGVLGLSSPTPRALLRSARWAAARSWMASVFLPVPAPVRLLTATTAGVYYVVDDDGPGRQALCDALEARGARVRAFGDELSLLSAVEQHRPRAILLDVVLRWVDGLRLCEELLRWPSTRDIPVFVMSGLDRPHVRARALAAGAAGFLSKPLDLQQLWQCLTRLEGGEDRLIESSRRAS